MGGPGFDSRAGEIGYSVANGSPLLPTFFRSCVAQALSCGDGPRPPSLVIVRFGVISQIQYNEKFIFLLVVY